MDTRRIAESIHAAHREKGAKLCITGHLFCLVSLFTFCVPLRAYRLHRGDLLDRSTLDTGDC